MSKNVFTLLKFSTEVCINIMDWINNLKFENMEHEWRIVFVFASSEDALFSSNNTSNYFCQQMNTCYMDFWLEHFSLKYENSQNN